MPLPSGVKLRESCDACAASKVRCTKEKPICSRCEDRGMACQYLVTQKTGRKLRRRETAPAVSSQALTPPLSSATPSSPRLESLSGLPLLESPFGALDMSGTPYTSLEDFISSFPMGSYLSMPAGTADQGLVNNLTPPDYTQELFGPGSAIDQVNIPFQSEETPLPVSVGTGLEGLDAGFPFPPAAGDVAQQPVETPHLINSQLNSQRRDSLNLALQLMAQLSCQDDESPPTSAGTSIYPAHPTAQASELQTVITNNKSVMDTVSTMLASTSSQDGYCLVVICLVISKVLSTYIAAAHGLSARKTDQPAASSSEPSLLSSWPTSATEPVPLPTSASRPEKPGPRAAQRLLDELYHVQASVDQLGAKMRLCAKRNRTFGGEAFASESDDTALTFPFSSMVLEQLYAELRKRLSTLSLELLDEIKRYWA